MTWFAVNTRFMEDEKLTSVAIIHGPAGYAVWIVVLAAAKERGKTLPDGRREVALYYDRLAVDSGLVYQSSVTEASPRDRAKDVLKVLGHAGLLDFEETGVLGAVVRITRWKKHQEDALHARRQDAYRTRKKAAGKRTSVTEASPTDTRTDTRTKGRKPNERETEIVDRFKLIASRRTGKALKVDVPALLRALDDFAHLPELRQHSFDCAEWLGSGKGLQREDAARVLRAWLKRDAEKLPAERKERRGSNRFVQNAA